MMARNQITLEREFHRRAQKRANELGVSFAEYVRRLVKRDLSQPKAAASIESIFNLGSSGAPDIAINKDAMIAEAFDADANASVRRSGRSR
jgi:hypothetical protein